MQISTRFYYGGAGLVDRMWSDGFMDGSAIFSRCGTHRYLLVRSWMGGRGKVNFLMLNPSTADEKVFDPTVRRCYGYAADWGFSQLIVTNLFALRSTDPKEIYKARDPFGPQNMAMIRLAAETADLIVCAWGSHGKYMGAGKRVSEELRQRFPEKTAFLTLTKSGEPGHPLYLKSSLRPINYVTGEEIEIRHC